MKFNRSVIRRRDLSIEKRTHYVLVLCTHLELSSSFLFIFKLMVMIWGMGWFLGNLIIYVIRKFEVKIIR